MILSLLGVLFLLSLVAAASVVGRVLVRRRGIVQLGRVAALLALFRAAAKAADLPLEHGVLFAASSGHIGHAYKNIAISVFVEVGHQTRQRHCVRPPPRKIGCGDLGSLEYIR